MLAPAAATPKTLKRQQMGRAVKILCFYPGSESSYVLYQMLMRCTVVY